MSRLRGLTPTVLRHHRLTLHLCTPRQTITCRRSRAATPSPRVLIYTEGNSLLPVSLSRPSPEPADRKTLQNLPSTGQPSYIPWIRSCSGFTLRGKNGGPCVPRSLKHSDRASDARGCPLDAHGDSVADRTARGVRARADHQGAISVTNCSAALFIMGLFSSSGAIILFRNYFLLGR